MDQYDGPARGDEEAELRLRVVFAIFDNGALWPVYGPRPHIVRATMATQVQADVDDAIDEALALATEVTDLGPEGQFFKLKADVRDWLKAVSSAPGGNGMTNAVRLLQAFRAAEGGGFRPNEFAALWQELRTKPEYRPSIKER